RVEVGLEGEASCAAASEGSSTAPSNSNERFMACTCAGGSSMRPQPCVAHERSGMAACLRAAGPPPCPQHCPRRHRMSGLHLTPPSDAPRQALIAGLSAEEARVLLQHGTEAPFCGVFLDNKRDGVYCCRLCALPLFRSSTKFDSGTGWPSFFAPFAPEHVREIRDSSHGMV